MVEGNFKMRRRKINTSAFDIVNDLFMLLVIIITAYPFVYAFSCSFSDPFLVMQNKIKLIPHQLTLANYKFVFSNNGILIAYFNTILYTVVGTALSVILTTSMAYPLSRQGFVGKNFFMFVVSFTMLFSGGLIPSYLVIQKLHMVNTIWAVTLPGCIGAWNVIITRTFFQALPAGLEEAAIIDGCNDIQVFLKIVLPVSMPVIAVNALFSAVGYWNMFFAPLIYLNEKSKYPLQIFLRSILIEGNMTQYLQNQVANDQAPVVAQSIKYTSIIVTTLPIICVYPFLQKYFVKGVMIGAIKG